MLEYDKIFFCQYLCISHWLGADFEGSNILLFLKQILCIQQPPTDSFSTERQKNFSRENSAWKNRTAQATCMALAGDERKDIADLY